MATINAKSNKKEFITIKSGSGDDTITLEDGNFKVYAGKGDDNITLSDGDNYVYAQNGNNTITFGSGNNKVYAGKGKDEFVFDSDLGNDVIYNSTAEDTITFGDNLDDTVFSFIRKGSDLIITDNVDTQENKIVLSKYFKSKSKLNDYTQNGEDKKILDETFYYAGKGKIKGTKYNDAIVGSAKKDTIRSYAGNDMIMGGLSNDKIYSGEGENTIIINNGDGHDVLYVDKKATSNTLKFDMGDTVSYSKSGKDLVISATDGAKSSNVQALTIKDYFTKKGYDAIKSDINIGSVGKAAVEDLHTVLAEEGITIEGSEKKANKLYGAKLYDNTIVGGNKNDVIYAGDMNNRISGGKGNDKYYSDSENINAKTLIFDEEGNDFYEVDSLDTSVYIQDKSGSKDVLEIDDDIRYTMFFDVSVKEGVEQYNSLFIVDNKNIQDKAYTEYTAGGIEIADFFNGNNYGVGRIEKITVDDRRVDTSLAHFDAIRSNVEAWLTNEAHSFDSAMSAFETGTADEIQQLIAIYQG